MKELLRKLYYQLVRRDRIVQVHVKGIGLGESGQFYVDIETHVRRMDGSTHGSPFTKRLYPGDGMEIQTTVKVEV